MKKDTYFNKENNQTDIEKDVGLEGHTWINTYNKEIDI